MNWQNTGSDAAVAHAGQSQAVAGQGDAEVQAVAGRIMGHLARRYIDSGWQRSGVTPNSMLDRDYAALFVPALTYLCEQEAVYISVQDLTLLTPLLRLDLATEETLLAWRESMRKATVLELEDFVHAARTELHALTAFAVALGDALPADMDRRCAGMAALLAVRGFDTETLRVIKRYGGPPHALFRHLVRFPGTCFDTGELHDLLVELARTRPEPRRQLPLPALSDVVHTAGKGQPAAWEPRNAWASGATGSPRNVGAGAPASQRSAKGCPRCGRPSCHH